MGASPLTIAWLSDFPVEGMADLPNELQNLEGSHPLTWQAVLLGEFEKNPALRLHIIALRKNIERSISFERNGVTFHVLKTRSGWRAPSFFWTDTLLSRRVLNRIKPDLVHAWGTERGAALVASRMGYPYVVTIQGLLTWYNEVVPLRPYERIMAFLEQLSLHRARIVTTESKFAVEYLQKRYRHLSVHQAEHAPNWIFHKLKRQPQTDPTRFISIGSNGYRKGFDLLLKALNALLDEQRFELALIGDSDDQPFLDALRAKTSPELWRRLEFKTRLSPSQVAAEIARATLMIHPTRADTSPNAVKEAAVAGLPVVASAIGGIPDYIFPNENGFLFPSENLNECIHAIRAACEHPLFGNGSVNPASLARTRDYLSPAKMATRFFDIYRCTLEEFRTRK